MFRNSKWIGMFAVFLLSVSFIASQLVYASQKEETDPGKTEKTEETKETEDSKTLSTTLVVGRSDYTEKTVLKDIQWIFPRHDSLSIAEQQSTFIEYLVSNGQEVKKGDLLLSYQVPVDSISLEEMKLSLERNENAYIKEVKQKKDVIKELQNNFQRMNYSTIEAQVQALNISKLEIELEQYQIQIQKSIDDMRATVKELEKKLEPQFLEAPYDGFIVLNDNLEAGTNIEAYKELVHIYDTNSAILGTEINGVNKFWYGMEVAITGISNMKEDKSNIHKGKVISVDTLFNGKVSTGMIYILPEDKDLFSTIQRANIAAESVVVKDVLVIPVNVVKFENDMSYVYLLDDKDEVRKQYISGRDNGTDMWVYAGLSEGQRIVVE